ncbi:sensor histidine kinase [Paenibacillus sp. GCM10012307]|uniref:histidine kinase n=1 Tax=Paenibacillus roseus TaxID=2798579 RepID=A0A934MR97_9BACL|nr:histidine kinase [Paenibacillus roseus]MBJ6362678.1 sensor histidine kinase [Paenibacillus roseus]
MKFLRSIRSQMVFFFSILLLLPVLGSAAYVYWTVQTNLLQSYARHHNQSAEALSDEIAKWRKEYESLMLRIFGDPLVQRFLNVKEWKQTAELFTLSSDVRNRLVAYGDSGEFARSIFIMNNDYRISGSTAISPKLTVNLINMTEKVNEADGSSIWFNGYDEGTIVIARHIMDNRYDLNRKIGYMFILLDKQEVLNMFEQFILDEGQQFAVFDNEHQLDISSTTNWDPRMFVSGVGTAAGYSVFQSGSDKYSYFTIHLNDWNVATWMLESKINEPIRNVLIAFAFVTFTLLIFTIVMVVFISHRITRPLQQLQSGIKHLGSGQQIQIPILRNDEIGQVANKLNMMSDEIAVLIEKNREEQEKRRMLELQTLEYQINPHFLYNTLDSVYMLARKYGDSRIRDIVTSLSRLFRIGLNQGQEIISVEAEVMHVSHYLKIQGIRFEEQLHWEIDLDEEAGKQHIIKFLLQPLVENSIMHGIRQQCRQGTVTVRAAMDKNRVVLTVSDDGQGMTAERLAEVRRSLEREEIEDSWSASTMEKGGFGLRNVHQRIRLHYGSSYGIELSSELGKGTTAVIRLPVQQKAKS